MKSKITLLLFIGIILIICFYRNQGSSFTEMTTPSGSQYDNADSDGNVLIFYANWCGHCNSAKPEFIKATEQGDGKVIMVNVDDESAKSIREKYEVKGFPTILKVSGNTYVKYEGGRVSTDILSFLNNSEN
jgi:thiol-disulfide isomerase/thioredoxin